MPMRSTKVSEKLVLIPDTSEEEAAAKKGEYARDNDDEPLRTEEEEERRRHQRRMSGEGDDGDGYGDERMRNKSYAERLPKSRRTEKVARVTAYCTAQAYKLRATADFVKTKHRARTKLYDDCLYTVYHLPLLKGVSGLQVRSSLSLKVPGGKSMLDEEIEWNEQFGYRDQHSDDGHYGVNQFTGMDGNELWEHQNSGHYEEPHTLNANGEGQQHRVLTSINDINKQSSSPTQISSNTVQVGELYIFSYGVIVFWNFSERQEKDILADLTFSAVGTCFSLVTRPQRDEDFETEEFHFEYDPDTPRPRIYNDMITLRSGDHMIKLAMSHAIAQSTKLSFFEERMARTMQEAQHVPRRLALTGKLGMKREEVVGILGRLYMSRVDVNLCEFISLFFAVLSDLTSLSSYWLTIYNIASNMLDTPNFFWDSEPTLHPLYDAVREYLEIKSRIQVLNERCRVFLDLAEILSDAIADKKMTCEYPQRIFSRQIE